MKPHTDSTDSGLPVYESEDDASISYTLEVVASLSGVDSGTILRYQEQGLIQQNYNAESLRRIRSIRYVETEYQAGPPALKLILSLYDELETLRTLVKRL